MPSSVMPPSMRSPSHPASRCGCPVIPRSDAGSREYPPLSSRTPMQHQVIPHSDAASRNTCEVTRKIHFSGPRITCGVTPFVMPPSMRSPSHPVPRCGIQECPLFTPRETVRTVGMHGLCILPVICTRKGPCPRFPFSFPAKEKGKPKESSRLMSES